MKVAVTAKGTDLGAEVDPRFGRAAHFVLVDSETLEHTSLDNHENADSFQGAGIQAAATLSQHGVELLLTGYCGPNAFKSLTAAKIKVANDATGTVRQALEAYLRGDLPLADAPNKEGHW
jgi:predicted Fe-Mo cluster-binding NifX family protein